MRKDGSKKVGGFGIGRGRQWASSVITPKDKAMIKELYKIKTETDDAMKHEFSVQQMIKNGTSTFIGSRGY